MRLQGYVESDILFYCAIGVLVILVYVTAITVAVLLGHFAIDGRLFPLNLGFATFMVVYFFSIAVWVLVSD